MPDRAFRWQRVADGLHAISNRQHAEYVFPGDEVRTLCGITATLTRGDYGFRLATGAPIPTCVACTSKWIEAERLAHPLIARRGGCR